MSARQLFDRTVVHRACNIALALVDELNNQAAGPVYRKGEIIAIKNWALVDSGLTGKDPAVELTFEMFVAIPTQAWREVGVLP